MKLELYYPVSPARLNQGFGVNGAYYQANGINIIGHNGLDLQAYHGQPVYAAHDGTAFYEEDSSAGHGVVIVGNAAVDTAYGTSVIKTIYWHLCDPVREPKYASPIWMRAGQTANSGRGFAVKTGDLIGYADSTGLSSGDHLHFGLKPIVIGVAPRSGDAPDVGIGNWIDALPTNGYLGAIDPTPYFNGFFAPQATQAVSLLMKLAAVLRQYVFILQHAPGPAQELPAVSPAVPVPPPAPAIIDPMNTPSTSRLEAVGRAIEQYEGMDKTTCNPFALRSSPFETGQQCYPSKGCFATFATYQDGWDAGMHQLTIVANGTSPAYTGAARKLGLVSCADLTLEQFFGIYSPAADQNDPKKYSAFVSNTTGINLATRMGDLLT